MPADHRHKAILKLASLLHLIMKHQHFEKIGSSMPSCLTLRSRRVSRVRRGEIDICLVCCLSVVSQVAVLFQSYSSRGWLNIVDTKISDIVEWLVDFNIALTHQFHLSNNEGMTSAPIKIFAAFVVHSSHQNVYYVNYYFKLKYLWKSQWYNMRYWWTVLIRSRIFSSLFIIPYPE